MAEGVAAATSSDVDAAAQRAVEQARLRKERREAKIKAGGSARLNKITGIGGRIVGETDQATPAVTPVPTSTPSPVPVPAADPDEVDISQHFYTPGAAATPPRREMSSPSPGPNGLSDAQLRQMMLGLDRGGLSGSPGPNAMPGGAPGAGGPDDQLMKMMSQIMGGAGMSPGSSPFPGMPSLEEFQKQQQQQQQQQHQASAAADRYIFIFRMLHALLALGLGLYVTLFTPFIGTRAERESAALAHEQHLAADDDNERRKRVFFWIFATGEALLLSSRFFLDKGRQPPSGLVWTAVGFLPEPLRGYVTVVLKYGQIFTTVRSDILACIFVLGVCSWWKA